MTKSDIVEALATKLNFSKDKMDHIMDCLLSTMEDSLKAGQRIEIRGFGSFEIRNYKAYQGRNPRSGISVSVQPKKLPFFKAGKGLKERINRA